MFCLIEFISSDIQISMNIELLLLNHGMIFEGIYNFYYYLYLSIKLV